jgi:hypothetical protein
MVSRKIFRRNSLPFQRTRYRPKSLRKNAGNVERGSNKKQYLRRTNPEALALNFTFASSLHHSDQDCLPTEQRPGRAKRTLDGGTRYVTLLPTACFGAMESRWALDMNCFGANYGLSWNRPRGDVFPSHMVAPVVQAGQNRYELLQEPSIASRESCSRS